MENININGGKIRGVNTITGNIGAGTLIVNDYRISTESIDNGYRLIVEKHGEIQTLDISNGVGINKIEKIGSTGDVDNYRITLSDGTTFDYEIETNEASRSAAELQRVEAELTRSESETERIENEAMRVNAESDRVNAETERAETFAGYETEIDRFKTELVTSKDTVTENTRFAIGEAEESLEVPSMDEFTQLKGDLIKHTGSERINMTDGFVKTNVSVGSVVDITPVERPVGWKHGIVPCVVGDEFVVSGAGGYSPRLYAFTDSTYKLVSASKIDCTATEEIVKAPCDGYIIINTNNDATSYKGVFVKQKIEDIDAELNATNRRIGDIEYVLKDGCFVHKNYGTEHANNAFACTDYFKIGYSVYVSTYVSDDYSASIAFFDDSKNFISGINDYAKNGENVRYEAPKGACYARVSCLSRFKDKLYINSAPMFDEVASTKVLQYDIGKMIDIVPHKIQGNDLKYLNKTADTISYAWSGNECTVIGVNNSVLTSTNIFYSKTAFPNGIKAGDDILVAFSSTDKNILVNTLFYKDNAVMSEHATLSNVGIISIPSDAEGILIRIIVRKGIAVNGVLRFDYIAVSNNKSDLYHLASASRLKAMKKPLILTIIDDDTTNDDYVTKFHDACLHNGVVGNYAVLTQRIESGNTSASKLLGYEGEGFGMLIHAYSQGGEVAWGSLTEYKNECRSDLAKGLRQMKEYGFANYNYWVIPYGYTSKDGQAQEELTRFFGLECCMSTGSRQYCTMDSADRYFIPRLSFNPTDADTETKGDITSLKKYLSDCAEGGSGWAIVTTHFNEWDNHHTWDGTLDGNGYPIGYSRFNELVQYALELGYECVSFQVGWSYYKHVVDYYESHTI